MRDRRWLWPCGLVAVLTLFVFLGATHPAADARRGASEKPEAPVPDEVKIDPRLVELRSAFETNPDDLNAALALAQAYIQEGRRQSDPRYESRAESVLGPWLHQEDPDPRVLVLRATLKQSAHEFDGALEDLELALKKSPRDAQAWLTRAVILELRGEHAEALKSCRAIARLAPPLIVAACAASTQSLSGKARPARTLLEQVLEKTPEAPPAQRAWALAVLADIEVRLGEQDAALETFRETVELGPPSAYLLGAYADLLLERGRYAAVLELIDADTDRDPLLLRRVIAERASDTPGWEDRSAALAERFAASRALQDEGHLREEARYWLTLGDRPDEALRFARANWNVQRLPEDARLVVEAALRNGAPKEAAEVVAFVDRTQLEDVRLEHLLARLGPVAQDAR